MLAAAIILVYSILFRGTTVDYDKAFAYITTAAQQGDVFAQFWLGSEYAGRLYVDE